MWAEQNNMLYNDDKFEMITFGTNNSRIYTSPIARKDSLKDLGVYISSDGILIHISQMQSRPHNRYRRGFYELSAPEIRKL